MKNKAAGKSTLSSRRVDVKTGKRFNAFPKLPATAAVPWTLTSIIN